MAVSRPETAGSPLPVPCPKVEGHLASLARDWTHGALQFLPLVHALWAGERGAAAGAAAAGAVAVARELGSNVSPGTKPTEQENKSLDSWAWKIAEKLGRDVSCPVTRQRHIGSEGRERCRDRDRRRQ